MRVVSHEMTLSRLALAIATVVDQRHWQDWAWLDQDRALHRP
jgi:hypothetical protein